MMDDTTPAEAEATGIETVTIDVLGNECEIPATTDYWDIDVARAFAAQDAVKILELLIGKDRFAEIEKAHRKANGGRLLVGDLEPASKRIAEIYGFDSVGG